MPWLLDWFKSPRRKAADCFEKGRLALDQNDFDLAISWFNACIHHDPTGDTGFYGRGFAHLKKGNYDAAIADLSEAIRLGPDNPYSYYYRSLSYGGMGRATLEAADFERALKLGVEVDGGSSAEADFSGPSTGPSDRVVMALRAAIRETSQHDLDERIRALAAKAFSQLESRAPTQVAALLEALGN